MSAADKREELEATIWRERGGDPRRPAADVDRILAAADAYATASIADALDHRARASRLAAAEASAAEHRDQLATATAERTGRTS